MGDNPRKVFNPTVSGVGIGVYAPTLPPKDQASSGSIGLFVRAGAAANNFVLTNEHVAIFARADGLNMAQPGEAVAGEIRNIGPPTLGQQTPDSDVALIGPIPQNRTVRNATYVQNVINGPFIETNFAPVVATTAQLAGLVGNPPITQLYKYGLATRYTTGSLVAYPYTLANPNGNRTNTIYVRNFAGTAWANEGDSGSVIALVRASANGLPARTVVGLNFVAASNPPYDEGWAFGITAQLNFVAATYIPPALEGVEQETVKQPQDEQLPADLQRLHEIYAEKTEEIMCIPGVSGFGVGCKQVKGEFVAERSIVIFVPKKLSLEELKLSGKTPLPKHIVSEKHGRVEVDVQEASIPANIPSNK